MNDQPDPLLKQAMAEIKVILDKHDLAAAVTLVRPGAAEHLMKVNPSWSVMLLEKDDEGNQVARILCLLKDFVSKEAQKKALEDTCSMLFALRDISKLWVEGCTRTLKMVSKHMSLEHKARRVK